MAPIDLCNEWLLHAPVEAVWTVLADEKRYPQWWPGFIRADRVAHDVVDFRIRGFLGVPIRFTQYVDVRSPRRRVEFRLDGALVGHGSWELTPVAAGSHVTVEGQVDLGPRWLRILAKLPGVARVIVRKHQHMMARGRHALEVLVGRRNSSATADDRP